MEFTLALEFTFSSQQAKMPTRTSLLQPAQFAHYIFLSAYPYLQLCPLSCFLNIPKFIPYEAYKYLLFYIQYESTFREV